MLALEPGQARHLICTLNPKSYPGLSVQDRTVLWVPGMPSLGHVHGHGVLLHCLLPFGPTTLNPESSKP